MKKEEFKKFKEIIDSLEIDYYEEENEKLNKEIENIMANRPKYEGIYNFDSTVVPPEEKDKTIKKATALRIKDEKEIAKKKAEISKKHLEAQGLLDKSGTKAAMTTKVLSDGTKVQVPKIQEIYNDIEK